MTYIQPPAITGLAGNNSPLGVPVLANALEFAQLRDHSAVLVQCDDLIALISANP